MRSRVWTVIWLVAFINLLGGAALLLTPWGGPVTRSSYDLPFLFRPNLPVTNAAIVYLDEASHRELDQPMNAPWDRALHARLIRRLVDDGARAIVFDIIFSGASASPDSDQQLEQSMRSSRRVVLAGDFQNRETVPGATGSWEELPYDPFRQAASGWGNANLSIDPDYGVRRFFPDVDNVSGQTTVLWMPESAARLAAKDTASVLDREKTGRSSHWVNFFGPPGTIPGISYFVALQPDGPPPGFFKDKIVFIGAQMSSDFSGKGKDEFHSPYAFWGNGFSPGVEIQATCTLNLLQSNWLVRLPPLVELALIVASGILFSLVLIRLMPWQAAVVSVLATLLTGVGACLLAWKACLWFDWLLMVYQIAFTFICSLIYNSIRLHIEKRLLESSLSAHLSPALVKRLLQEPALRRRGGQKQEVSMLFTDMENFSRISESMHPDDLVNLLNRYFEAALQCIHETDGTVMDLVGDAIFAIWNAPVEQSNHRELAFQASLRLQEKLAGFEHAPQGFTLRTRIGLHCGIVSVGNIGSEQRFDYAAVGDQTNLASRLEGLNKHFKTTMLASREIQRVVENKVTSRLVGHVQVKGFAKAVEVYEIIGPPEALEPTRPWRELFATAITHFRRRDFDQAARLFTEVDRMRPEGDGPSQFYLYQIEQFRETPPPPDWIGEITMKDK